jgi:DNA-binding CsgD family transcriptional regulator/tetratricopeptide (TPR) repeat protein/exonuclease VII small subunit
MVGRVEEHDTIRSALDNCRTGRCPPVLIGGEAGIGKSHLLGEGLRDWDGVVLQAASHPGGGLYAAVSRILRICSASFGEDVIDHAGATVLSGTRLPDDDGNMETLADGFAATLREVSRRAPTVVVLEDLHWASAATIGLLPRLVTGLAEARVLLMLSYRSDELARSHPVRSMRAELRRAGPLIEVVLGPLSESETADLIRDVIGDSPSPQLAAAIHDRAGGIPLFVKELTAALEEASALTVAEAGVELSSGAAVPIPESIVDAVLLRANDLMDRADHAVELAAVLGVKVDLDLLAEIAGAENVDVLLESSLLTEADSDAEFRHALIRDALYRTIPWARRRAHHQRVAEVMTKRGAAPYAIAGHWLSAHQHARARPLLLAAAERFCELGAYRDAAHAIRNALANWPAGENDAGRADILERLADCAEMCGELSEAADTWTETAEMWRQSGDRIREAAALRRLANAADMRGAWEDAVSARRAAAAAFTAAGQPNEAASDHLALAQQLESASHPTQALEHADAAIANARDASRDDLLAHALSLKGVIVAALGDTEEGLAISRSGVELALDLGHIEAAASGYYELATTLAYASDYATSTETWGTAVDFCRAHDLGDQSKGCLACMAVALRLLGDWDRAVEVARQVLDDAGAPPAVHMVAQEERALIHALRGRRRGIRSLLRDAEHFGRSAGIFGIEVGAMWGLAAVADSDDHIAEARRRSLSLIERCEQTEPSHFALPALRWVTTWFSRLGPGDEALGRGHRLLARYAVDNSPPKILSVLAHARGEVSLVDDEPERAVEQFSQSLELLGHGAFPFDTALTQFRLGVALAATAERDRALDTIAGAYRTARQLDSKPLARRCAQALEAMGEKVDHRLGRLAARTLEPAGLTRRERQVLRLVASGATNRAIGEELYINVRTVDMHVRNILAKLDCSSRSAATRRAVELGLLEQPATAAPENTA